jgi:aldehyde:ferredoxin oxidoreductase
MNNLNQENLQKKIDFINKKKIKKVVDKVEYTKDYYANITKNRMRHCEICEHDIKYNSFVNHLKSKKHTALIKIILATQENPICVEL